MNTVRNSAKTSFSILAFGLLLMLLVEMCNSSSNERIQRIIYLFNSSYMCEPVFRTIQKIGFWSMFIVSIELAVLHECAWLGVITAFVTPLLVFALMAGAAQIMEINEWIWIVYFILLLFGVRSSFRKLTYECGDTNASTRLRYVFSERAVNKSNSVNTFDWYVVHITKIILFFVHTTLVGSFALYIWQNW